MRHDGGGGENKGKWLEGSCCCSTVSQPHTHFSTEEADTMNDICVLYMMVTLATNSQVPAPHGVPIHSSLHFGAGCAPPRHWRVSLISCVIAGFKLHPAAHLVNQYTRHTLDTSQLSLADQAYSSTWEEGLRLNAP